MKGAYAGERLDALCRDHAGLLSDPEGRGCIWGFSVSDRAAFLHEAWRQGAKLLGAGKADGRAGRVRLIFLADVLTREIDDTIDVLERTCCALEASL